MTKDDLSFGGIYLLVKDNTVVYVGKSDSNIYNRVRSHKELKQFDYAIAYKINSLSDIAILEVVFINILLPELNICSKSADDMSIKVNIPKKLIEDIVLFNILPTGPIEITRVSSSIPEQITAMIISNSSELHDVRKTMLSASEYGNFSIFQKTIGAWIDYDRMKKSGVKITMANIASNHGSSVSEKGISRVARVAKKIGPDELEKAMRNGYYQAENGIKLNSIISLHDYIYNK